MKWQIFNPLVVVWELVHCKWGEWSECALLLLNNVVQLFNLDEHLMLSTPRVPYSALPHVPTLHVYEVLGWLGERCQDSIPHESFIDVQWLTVSMHICCSLLSEANSNSVSDIIEMIISGWILQRDARVERPLSQIHTIMFGNACWSGHFCAPSWTAPQTPTARRTVLCCACTCKNAQTQKQKTQDSSQNSAWVTLPLCLAHKRLETCTNVRFQVTCSCNMAVWTWPQGRYTFSNGSKQCFSYI